VGVNLVTRVRNFSIQNATFTASDHDVQDGCVTPGNHKLLRFDFLSHNAGTADLVVGSPAARPDLFVWSAGHGHYHLKDFNEFLLFTAAGALATVGYKQAFCAIDIERISPTASASARFNDCNSNQGISAGWADVYSAFLACQFIVIDGLPNGDYTLQSTTNALHRVVEDCYGDNTIWTGLRIGGNTVQVIDPPYIPEDRIPFNRANVAAVQAGGRWKVAEGNHWMLDTGSSQWEAQRAVEIINHYRLASLCFVGRPRCGDVAPMMYWLTATGRAPSGQLPGEDCIAFDRASLAVVQIGERWKVVEGTHWLLDFGPGQGNAVAALHFIRKYAFDQICFVGRPDPSMTYFKATARRGLDVVLIDPRRIEAAIDHPRWWTDQAVSVVDRAPWIDLGAECVGTCPNPRKLGGFDFQVRGADTIEIVERHGIRGLAAGKATEIRLASPAQVVDLGIAHFGEPPTVTAFAGEKRVAKATLDERQRQIENVRLTGDGIERVTIASADGGAVLNYVRYQPGERLPKATRKGGRR
jgi:Lysyl oxidase